MADTFQLQVATPERLLVDEQVTEAEIPGKNGVRVIDKDEGPREDTTAETLRALKPAFKKDGSVTAGNASTINDGAAAVVVMSARKAKQRFRAKMFCPNFG